MKLKKLTAACALACTTLLGTATPAQAQISGDVIKIGIITDMSGLYSDIDGSAGVEAMRMAVAEMGGAINGKKIELVRFDTGSDAKQASVATRKLVQDLGLKAE